MERTLLGVNRVCGNGAHSATLYVCSVMKEICVHNVTLFYSLPKSLRALEDYEEPLGIIRENINICVVFFYYPSYFMLILKLAIHVK